ncbi:MAG: hypothetical protein MUE81_11785 [Thermoflexibacter sp.]|jgi:hypothetical protein|nr:hypothetical protein [Thermoflexibacter sp.]
MENKEMLLDETNEFDYTYSSSINGNDNISVQGNQNNIFKIENHNVSNKLAFVPVNLEPYNNENYVAPIFTQDIFKILKNNKILIISGNSHIDKNSLVKHIANLVKLESDILKVKELRQYENANIDNISSYMKEEEYPTIFIFNQITPEVIGYDIIRLQQVTNDKAHYIIISTEASKAAMGISEAAKTVTNFWFDLPEKIHYDNNKLSNLLHKLIVANSLDSLTDAIKKIQENIDYQLENPIQIEMFVNMLTNTFSENLKIEDINKLIVQVKAESNHISKWFNNLDETNKLIVVGMMLLDGLYEDQFFIIIDTFFNDAWYSKGSQGKFIDYQNLIPLLSFSKFENIGAYDSTLTSSSLKQKRALLEYIWKNYKRHIITSAALLNKLVFSSTNKNNWLLFGTYEKRSTFRNVVANTLSDLGMIADGAIMNLLIELASSEDIWIRSIAAKSVARWREFDKHENTFKLMEDWLQDSEDILSGMLDSFRANNKIASKYKPEHHLDSTVALVLGYASRYDQPDRMSPRLIEILERLLKNTNALVRESLENITLPIIITNHFQILNNRGILFEMVTYNYMEILAKIFKEIYKYHPEKIIDILTKWIMLYEENNKSSYSTTYIMDDYDKALYTVFLTYKLILSDSKTSSYDFVKRETVLEKLEYFRQIVKNTTLKKLIIDVKIDLIGLDLNPQLIKNLKTLEEKVAVKDELVETYLEERVAQEQEMDAYPDGYFAIRNYKIPIWLDEKRTTVKVENQMYDWVQSQEETIIQIAGDVFREIVFIEQIEQIERINVKELKINDTQAVANVNRKLLSYDRESIKTDPIFTRVLIITSYFSRLNKYHRFILKNLVVSTLNPNKSLSKNDLEALLNKWKYSGIYASDKTVIRDIAVFLQNRLGFINWVTAKIHRIGAYWSNKFKTSKPSKYVK